MPTLIKPLSFNGPLVNEMLPDYDLAARIELKWYKPGISLQPASKTLEERYGLTATMERKAAYLAPAANLNIRPEVDRLEVSTMETYNILRAIDFSRVDHRGSHILLILEAL
jgi:hypothetical protein